MTGNQAADNMGNVVQTLCPNLLSRKIMTEAWNKEDSSPKL